MENLMHWVEEHPYMAAAIGLGGLLILLWLLGFFSSSSSTSSSSGANNLATAYYAAEQAQTVAGTQLNMATVQANSQDAMATTQANAAVAIANAQYGAATTINGQNASASTQIANYGLLASQTANNDALQASNTASNNAYLLGVNTNQAQLTAAAFNTIVPAEMAYSGGPTDITIPGLAGNLATWGGSPSPNALIAAGYPTTSPMFLQDLGYS